MCIIQCGNPLTNDAKIVMDDIVINCEIKSMPSLLADLDLLYDENGKYIMPDDERYDGYTDIISYFNHSNSVYMQSGSNYKIFEYLPTAIADDILENYFNLSSIDVSNIAVTVNGKPKPIIKVGAFFASENCVIAEL